MPQATPGARRLAKELGVDLDDVKGTGKRGYILEGDVTAYLPGHLAVTEAALETANGKEALPPFPDPAKHEDYKGEVYPVSALFKMRFRQDDGHGDLVGEDLLAIRPQVVGGRYRSHEGTMGWFVADRGFFLAPVESIPVDLPDEPEPVDLPDGGHDGTKEPEFAVSK
ncbi:hypothetical protein LCGC14_3077970 [marine sediment metagenome]|uniref:Peripheral subunit-binding (PSBD) domain-containing protein n=1 Tax=marine sediment metagenome TaxID=412755 RepID=A0A0F8Z4U3_9ZZZZ